MAQMRRGEAGRSRRWRHKPETPACRLYRDKLDIMKLSNRCGLRDFQIQTESLIIMATTRAYDNGRVSEYRV